MSCHFCGRATWRVGNDCGFAQCPVRTTQPPITTTPTDVMPVHPQCPWCGLRGVDFDETPRPSAYCHHDPADIQ